MVFASWKAGQGAGLAVGIVLFVLSIGAWVAALADFRATPRDTITALGLLLNGYEAPAPSEAMRAARAQRQAPDVPGAE